MHGLENSPVWVSTEVFYNGTLIPESYRTVSVASLTRCSARTVAINLNGQMVARDDSYE